MKNLSTGEVLLLALLIRLVWMVTDPVAQGIREIFQSGGKQIRAYAAWIGEKIARLALGRDQHRIVRKRGCFYRAYQVWFVCFVATVYEQGSPMFFGVNAKRGVLGIRFGRVRYECFPGIKTHVSHGAASYDAPIERFVRRVGR